MGALEELVLTNTRVADLDEVGRLPNLGRLRIARTLVTNAAVRAFRKAHPKVTVHY